MLTSVVYKAHPQSTVAVISGFRNSTYTAAQAVTVTKALAKIAPALGDLGVGGLFFGLLVEANFILALPNGNLSQLVDCEFHPPFFSDII